LLKEVVVVLEEAVQRGPTRWAALEDCMAAVAAALSTCRGWMIQLVERISASMVAQAQMAQYEYCGGAVERSHQLTHLMFKK
jgi:hypothetical protein